MIAKHITSYVDFGTVVRYLQDAEKSLPIHGDGFIIDNLERLFRGLAELDLQVTLRTEAAEKLREFLRDLSQHSPEGASLTPEQASSLRRLITELRKTLFPELTGFQAYVVTPKRIDIQRLLHDVPSLFQPRIFDQLPDIAKYDVQEAAMCIAFERPTAAAFHLLRATEAVLRTFYCAYVKRNRVHLLWGPILEHLRRCRKTKTKQTLLSHLDNIRLSFRNPTQHPEKRYDIEEVQDLWSLCVDVINRMAKEIPAGNGSCATSEPLPKV